MSLHPMHRNFDLQLVAAHTRCVKGWIDRESRHPEGYSCHCGFRGCDRNALAGVVINAFVNADPARPFTMRSKKLFVHLPPGVCFMVRAAIYTPQTVVTV